MFRKRFLLAVLLASVGGLLLTASLTRATPLPRRYGGPAAEARTAALSVSFYGPLPEPPGSHALTSLPNRVNFQGLLTDPATGNPVADGTYSVRFSVWDADVGPNEVWNETQNVTTAGGLFSVLLGSVTDLTADAFNGTPRYLEVKVETDPAMTPRLPFVSVPFAFHALTADSANSAEQLAVDGTTALAVDMNITSPNLIGGYSGNGATSGVVGATIAGGGASANTNRVTDNYGTVSGGANNQAGDDAGTTGDHRYATVGGGWRNTASGVDATVGGGWSNTASSTYTTVGGGNSNQASGDSATVGGGFVNQASGDSATVPGGSNNYAAGNYSFAAGRYARANNQGCFVWGDSTNAAFNCSNDDRFMVRAGGGVEFYSSSDLSTWCKLNAGSGSWSCSTSDRDLKENFAPVDGRAVLAGLAQMPITTWNYRAEDPSIRHIGPTAQDLYAAFGLGEDERSVTSVDPDGLALAGIQGLYELAQDQDARIAALEERVAVLEGAAGIDGAASASSSSGLPATRLLLGGLLMAGLVLAGIATAVLRRKTA